MNKIGHALTLRYTPAMDAGAKFVMIAPIIPLMILVAAFWRLPWTAMRVAGLVLAAISVGLLTLARLQLGNSFSVTPQAKQVIKHGIYSKVRHPVYVFSALLLAGLVLYVNMPILFVAFAILIPVQVMRARAEEKVLVEKFGGEYADYRKTTWI